MIFAEFLPPFLILFRFLVLFSFLFFLFSFFFFYFSFLVQLVKLPKRSLVDRGLQVTAMMMIELWLGWIRPESGSNAAVHYYMIAGLAASSGMNNGMKSLKVMCKLQRALQPMPQMYEACTLWCVTVKRRNDTQNSKSQTKTLKYLRVRVSLIFQ